MRFIWISFFSFIAFFIFLNFFGFYSEIIIFFSILLHLIMLIYYLSIKYLQVAFILILGYILRFLTMIFDIFGRSIFIIPNSGGDTNSFYYWAVLVSKNLSLIKVDIRGGFYSKLIGILFYFIGKPNLILAQYINVLLGLSTIIIIYRILLVLQIKKNIIIYIIIITSFFPNSIIMSSILLREIFPTFLISVTLLYFIFWYRTGKTINILMSFFFLALASIFHSGVIGIFTGFLYFYLFYKRKENKFKVNFQMFSVFVIGFIFIFFVYFQYSSIFLKKFQSIEKISDVYITASSSYGESKYLENINIKNIPQLILYSPIKTFYFLFSPLPFDWRNLLDFITFLLDSSFYFVVILLFTINIKKIRENKILIKNIFITIIIVSIIFALGVSNAGTAIRHRQKITPLFFIIYGLILNNKKRYKEI